MAELDDIKSVMRRIDRGVTVTNSVSFSGLTRGSIGRFPCRRFSLDAWIKSGHDGFHVSKAVRP